MTDRLQPNELLEMLMGQARDQGRPIWTCINWGPDPDSGPPRPGAPGRDPRDTEVHLIIATELAGVVLRLKSRSAVYSLVTALRQNADLCWPHC